MLGTSGFHVSPKGPSRGSSEKGGGVGEARGPCSISGLPPPGPEAGDGLGQSSGHEATFSVCPCSCLLQEPLSPTWILIIRAVAVTGPPEVPVLSMLFLILRAQD